MPNPPSPLGFSAGFALDTSRPVVSISDDGGESVWSIFSTPLLHISRPTLVYVAQDTILGRKVAIKMLPAQVADSPEKRKNLEREARTNENRRHLSYGCSSRIESRASRPRPREFVLLLAR